MTGGRAIRDENHPLRNLPFNAFEGGLPPWGFDANGAPGWNANLLHVLGMHVHGPDGRLVVSLVFSRTDLLPLLRRPARVHQETPAAFF